MAMVTPQLLQSLMVGFNRIFEDAKGKAPSDWNKLATYIKGTGKSTTYGWLGQYPKLREWAGSRVVKDMAAHNYSIVNKTYEATVGIKRTDIEDDNLGVYTPLIQEMGYAAGTHPDEVIFSLLAAGHTNLCYDGQNFFDTDHPVYANVDGTGTVATVSNSLGSGTTPWFLLDVSRPLKPFIFQERTKPELTSITSVQNESVFMDDEYLHGVRYRCNGGYGFWQQAVRSTETLDADGFSSALQTLRGFKADGGRPLSLGRGGQAGLLLVVPSTLYEAALDVVHVDKLANGQSNKWKNAATILDSPWVDAV